MTNDASAGQLTTGDLARAAGLTTKAVRLYDERGLLHPARTSEGWRLFDRTQVDRARLIALLRSLGAPLGVVAELLEAGDASDGTDRGPTDQGPADQGPADQGPTDQGPTDQGPTDPGAVVGAFDRWWAREQAAHAGRAPLAELVRRRLAGEDLPALAAVRREVPEQLVLTVTCRTDAVGLPDALRRSAGTLFEQLTPDDVAGPVFTVYRGRVTPDGDGEVETCVPVVAPLRPARGSVLRVEPAATLAVVTVPGPPDAVGFARMVEVHDALSSGRFTLDGAGGAEPCGPNREITYPPHEEQRTDVAVPVG